MNFRQTTLSLIAAGFALAGVVVSQEGPLVTDPPKATTAQEIIQKFTAKEKEFKAFRKRCTYRQSVKMQTVEGESVTEEYQQVADVRLDENGKKVKTIVLAPQATMTLTPEDAEDIESRLHFTLSTDELPEYNVSYVGQQQQDDLHCYVFEVVPKQIEKNKRYFQGRIWVDDRDLQIVKMTGKSVPDIIRKKRRKGGESLFPRFTTYREVVGGKYWFPTYSSTDDTLQFPGGEVHIRGTVKAGDYKCSAP
jgi:outer membrane lipoprotein-sorting protein